MNVLKIALIAILLSSATVMAEPASERSVKQLLEITQAKKLTDGVLASMDAFMSNAAQQILKGKTPTAGQQQALTNMKNKTIALMQEEFAWEKQEPMHIRLYLESFTEEEIESMLSFYKTPAGQAVINKMPVLMQKTMLEVQKMTSGLIPKAARIQQEFAAEIAAAGK